MRSSTISPGSTSPSSGPVRTGGMLHRGEACLTCRRRKMKCDAGKPGCTPCIRAGKGVECEYEDTRYLVAINKLKDQVHQLQERIRELEGTGAGTQIPSTSSDTTWVPHHDRTPSDEGPSNLDITLPPLQSFASPLSPTQQQYPPAPVLQYTATPLPALVPASLPPPQHIGGWSSWNAGNPALQAEIQPADVQRLLTHFATRVHDYSLPTSSMPFLNRHYGLMSAAAACVCTIFQTQHALVLRADAALARTAARPSPLDIQTSVLLAHLAVARGRVDEGRRRLMNARSLAEAVNVDSETWEMISRAERVANAKAGGASSSSSWMLIPPLNQNATGMSGRP